MARQVTFKRASVALAGVGLMAVVLMAYAALAQQPAGAGGPNIEGIMATNDSLAFDSVARIAAAPVAEKKSGGIMGMISRSPLGKTGIGSLYVRGGVFMHWLLLAAIIGASYVIERFWTLSRARTDARKLIGSVITTLRSDGADAASQICQRTPGPVAAVMNAGLLKFGQGSAAVEKACAAAGAQELAYLERGLNWITAVINIAPLIGFLGTVSGMIHAFAAIATADQVNAKLVAGGISEALITTAAGLIIAIPCAAAYNYFVSVNDRFVNEMEKGAGELQGEVAQSQARH
ncbi:MAG: MotA/TolQ/ExbB proton channel family protein [Candidatus Krumholzibacteriia bacterium]